MIVTNEYIIRLKLKYWTSDRDEKGSFNVARFLQFSGIRQKYVIRIDFIKSSIYLKYKCVIYKVQINRREENKMKKGKIRPLSIVSMSVDNMKKT